MVLTTMGLVAIENIKAGDKVISTNPDTFETAEKVVLETYIRKTLQLVHLYINKELITTTIEHPFYVKEHGFKNAGNLQSGDNVVDVNGSTCLIENICLEILESPEKVYNFKVEEFHTYYVGNSNVWVHNADCGPAVNRLIEKSKPGRKTKGPTEQRIMEGNFETALADFDSLNPTGVKEIPTKWGTGKVGKIDDGMTAVARPGSSFGAPTLEIRNAKGRGIEFRYI